MDLVSRLLFRDGLMLVINKPAGVPVHAGPKGGPNLEDSFDQLRFGLPRLPALAHRLDRATSGCLILGRHRKALAKLGKLFQQGRIEKLYWAVVDGTPDHDSGTIDAPLAKRNPDDKRSWHMKVSTDGQPALTEWRVLGRAGGRAWLEFRPRTGRTHQIRVHAAHAGYWIYGLGGADENNHPEKPAPLLLHARAVAVPLYGGKPPITASASPPDAMAEALEQLEPAWREIAEVPLFGMPAAG